MKPQDENVAILRQAGIAQPLRLVNLIQKAIGFFELNLSGLTVLTEAASGPYVVTPVIAALAGAKRVLALTRDSRYASVETVKSQTSALEELCSPENRVEIFSRRSVDLYAKADIITNLGFVRPIDAEVIAAMKPGAVIPMMCEAWEFRPGDVDLEACRRRNIPVVGTNEDYPGLEVFDYSGGLCLKLLFEAQIEIQKSHIIIVSGDKFGAVIEKRLTQAGAHVRLLPNLCNMVPQDWREVDALVVADYTRLGEIIGPGGDLAARDLARYAPGLTVIQFAGQVDVAGIRESGLFIYPGQELGPRRMAVTLAGLGPRPVIDLHTAGLKIGELFARGSESKYDRLAQEI
jgi:hypothetical protein